MTDNWRHWAFEIYLFLISKTVNIVSLKKKKNVNKQNTKEWNVSLFFFPFLRMKAFKLLQKHVFWSIESGMFKQFDLKLNLSRVPGCLFFLFFLFFVLLFGPLQPLPEI